MTRFGNWKIVVKIWCLSAQMSQDDLRSLHEDIVSAARRAAGIPVQSESDMMVLFPADLMEYGTGEEIYIEVRSRDEKIKNEHLAQFSHKVVDLVGLLSAAESVDCDISDFNGLRVRATAPSI